MQIRAIFLILWLTLGLTPTSVAPPKVGAIKRGATQFMDNIWLKALALLLIFEGIGPFLFPNKWSGMLRQIAKMPPSQLRQLGLVLLSIGTVILWLV